MNTEKILRDALRAAEDYETSPNLWARVVHSIEEDTRHRRRVTVVAAAIVIVALILVAAGLLNVESMQLINGSERRRVGWGAMEVIEFIALGTLVAALGPAIRRFGRGYVADIFGRGGATGERLLQLLDVAYYLVFSGYILVTARFAAPSAFHLYAVGAQVEEALWRIGGLLLIMGVLHALTLVTMPVIGLVFNTTRTGRRLPRWVTILLVLAGVAAVWQGIGIVAALFGGLSG